MKKLILIVVTGLVLAGTLTAQEIKYMQKNRSVDVRVEDLLSRMTLEEKVSQMRIFHSNLGVDIDEKDSLVLQEGVKKRLTNGIGGIKSVAFNYSPVKAAMLTNLLQSYIIKNSRLGIPGFFVTESYNGVDAEGCTKFGRPIALAATWNTGLVRNVYDVVGREARLRGFHLTHSPEADLARDPRFGRMSETFGEDTYLTTEMIVNAVTGLQGDFAGLNRTHIGAVTKHMAGYAQVAGGKNFASIEISPRTFADEILPPFKAAVQRAHTLGIMASHGDINGIASHANPELLTKILRQEWGFNGYVVSDANDISRLFTFMKVAETPQDAVRLALIAGVDIDLYGEDAYALLPEMVKTNPELQSYIDQATRRVLRTKFILGLFENPFTDVQKAKTQIRNEQAKELAQRADLESVILLKNEKSILPIDLQKIRTVALVGPVLDPGAKAFFETVAGPKVKFAEEKGFELTNRNPSVPVLTTQAENQKGINQILDKSKQADLTILFVGDDEFTAKEAFFNGALGDRDNIDPVGQQDQLLVELKKLGKPVIVVLKHRRTLSINTIAEKADAILDCWELSEFGDQAVAKIIFGQAVPSGKLPVTVPHSIGQIPFHYSQKEINFKKGYLFADSKPLFCFGYGMSYTNFDYSNLQVSDSLIHLNSSLKVTIDVKNTGTSTGKEVVQLYIKDLCGSVVRPMKELKGFEKIELKAGESRTVSFLINPEMLEFTRLDMKKGSEGGSFVVTIGPSSEKGLSGRFKLIE